MRSVLIDDSFRPWAAAGITAFLADEDVFLALQGLTSVQPASRAAVKSRVSLGPSVGPFPGQSEGQALARPSGPSADQATSSQFRQHGSVEQSPPAHLPGAPKSAALQQARQQPSLQFGQTVSSTLPPAPVLWTYAHLGADLTGQGSPERSAFLRSVIQNLHLPKGTSVFWPFAFPENTEGSGTTEQGHAAFRQGVAVVSPKLLIFLGNDALAPMQGQIDLHLPFTQQLFQGRIYLLLPDFAALLQAPSLFDQTNSFLRAMLTAHGVIPGGR